MTSAGRPPARRGPRRRLRRAVGGQSLRKSAVDVPLIDRHGYNTFQPLLYQVATGGLNPGDVTFSLRASTRGSERAFPAGRR